MNRGRRLFLKLIASLTIAGFGYYVVSRVIPGALMRPYEGSKFIKVNSFNLLDNLSSFSISANGGVVLNERKFVFQLLPGSSGDYALLVDDGNVYLLLPLEYGQVGPNPVIRPNVDLSNITGSSTVGDFTAFGGGVVCYGKPPIPPPWSPCACPCSTYIGLYNRVNGDLGIYGVPGGSCDNGNFTFAVNGVSNDILIFGGGNYPAQSCECGQWCVTHRSGVTSIINNSNGLTFAGFINIDVVDDHGFKLWRYRMPGIRSGSNIIMLAQQANTSNLLVEYVDLSELYSSMSNNPSALCSGEPYVTPHYYGMVGNDFSPDAIPSIWISNGIHVTYHTIDGYVKVSGLNESIKLVSVPTTPFIKFINDTIYVAYNYNNVFTVTAFNPYNGNKLGEVSVNGIGFIDQNGYAVVFSSLNIGSLIHIFRVTS